MRRLFASVIACIVLALGASAQEDRNPAIEGVIQSQIEAFLADDFDRAFTYASPMIQGIFGTSERFGQMVRQGYPMVWRPGQVTYLELGEEGGRLVQKVLILDGAGVPYLLDYEMIESADGWLINGVRVLRAPEVGA